MNNEHRFQVIRFLIAVARFDGKFSKEEREFIKKQISMVNLDEEKKSLLSQVVYHDADPIFLFNEIKDNKTRNYAIHMARLLIFVNGDTKEERALIKNIAEDNSSKAWAAVDYSRLKEDMKRDKAKFRDRAERIKLIKENQILRSLFGGVHYLL